MKKLIAKVVGREIMLIDSAETTAQKVFTILKDFGWFNNNRESSEDEFYVTDFPERFKKVGEIFLNRKLDEVQIAPL